MAEAKFAQILITAKDATKQGFDSARQNARELQGALGGLSSGFAGVFNTATRVLPALAGVAGVFSAAGIAGAVVNTANALDAFNDSADATGGSIEKLSALEAIALRNGESLDIVTSAIVKLNQALSQSPDSDQAKVLAAIGLSADALREKDPAEALRDVAVALAKFENDGNKARIVSELLGKSARELAPFLGDVAAAGELNATVTARQAQEAEEFNKALSAVGAQVTQVGRAIGAEFLPPITAFIQRINEARVAGASFAEQLRQGFSGGEDIAEISQRIGEIDVALDKVVKRRTTAGSLFKGGLFGLANDIDESRLINERIALVERLNRLRAASAKDSVPEVPGLRAPDLTGLLAKPGKAAKIPKDNSDALERAAQQMVDDWSPLTLRWDLAANDFAGGANADLAKWQAEAEERAEALAESYRDIADPTRKYREELQLVTALETTGRLSAEEAFKVRSKLIEDEERALDGRNEKVKEGTSFAKEFGLTMTSAFEDAILQAESFGEVFSGLSKDIARIIIRSSITEPLGKATSNFFKDFDLGKTIGDFFGGGRATGGPVRAGKLYEVNETGGPGELLTANGRTFLMANQNGYVTPTGAGVSGATGGAAGGGGMVVNMYQTNTFQGGADPVTMSAWAARVEASTKQAVLVSLNRNGEFARATGRS
jgi:hypothetical protein